MTARTTLVTFTIAVLFGAPVVTVIGLHATAVILLTLAICYGIIRHRLSEPPADDPTPTTHVDEYGNRWNARWFTPEVTPLERGRR